ncbi:MAG: MFS transporter [Actinomycetaceae bacterium]|nr:MFS transporter [Actinomycetaceae bacterium]
MKTRRAENATTRRNRPETTPAARRARVAVMTLFFSNGALFANFVPRFPQLKDAFQLDPSGYGLVIAAFPLGAMIGGPLAGLLVRRLTSARIAAYGTVLIGVLLFCGASLVAVSANKTGPIATATVASFAAIYALAGATDAVVDVGQNAHGFRVQRLYGRSIVNAFHAAWSAGAMTGGLMGMAATAIGLPLGWHMGGVAIIFSIVGVWAKQRTLPGRDTVASSPTDQPHRINVRPWPTAVALGTLVLLALAGSAVEDISSTWSTLFMRDYLDVIPSMAASAYVCMLLFQLIGRASGDWFIDRFGTQSTVLVGGILMLLGAGSIVIAPNPIITVIGFALAGFGCATTVPIAMNAADDLPGLKAGTGLTIVSWLMRIFFFAAPPLIGELVEDTSLLSAIVVLPIAGFVTILATSVLAERQQTAAGIRN